MTHTCTNCHGSGAVPCPRCGGDGTIQGEKCYFCQGAGKVPCPACEGTGRIQEDR